MGKEDVQTLIVLLIVVVPMILALWWTRNRNAPENWRWGYEPRAGMDPDRGGGV